MEILSLSEQFKRQQFEKGYREGQLAWRAWWAYKNLPDLRSVEWTAKSEHD